MLEGPITRARSKMLGLKSHADILLNTSPRADTMPHNSSTLSHQASPTRAASSSSTTQGAFRCTCDGAFLSAQDHLIQCTHCHHWLHALCVGVPMTSYATLDPELRKKWICPFCTQADGRKRKRIAESLEKQAQLHLSEIKDKKPHHYKILQSYMSELREVAEGKGFELVEFPPADVTTVITDQAMNCLKSAIEDKTFSDSYPRYCLSEQEEQPHGYCQASMLRDKSTKKIVSLVLSNGMDPHGNMPTTVTQLKTIYTKYNLSSTSSSSHSRDATANKKTRNAEKNESLEEEEANRESSEEETVAKIVGKSNKKKIGAKKKVVRGGGVSNLASPLAGGGNGFETLSKLQQEKLISAGAFTTLKVFDDFVHFTLVGTHDEYRGRHLAKLLFAYESLRWLCRGRKRAFVNMALRKYLATTPTTTKKKGGGEGGMVICEIPDASYGLYSTFGYVEVCPRYDQEGAFRWSPKEADMGRVLGNLNIENVAINIAAEIIAAWKSSSSSTALTMGRGGRNARGGGRGPRASSSPGKPPSQSPDRLEPTGSRASSAGRSRRR